MHCKCSTIINMKVVRSLSTRHSITSSQGELLVKLVEKALQKSINAGWVGWFKAVLQQPLGRKIMSLATKGGLPWNAGRSGEWGTMETKRQYLGEMFSVKTEWLERHIFITTTAENRYCATAQFQFSTQHVINKSREKL